MENKPDKLPKNNPERLLKIWAEIGFCNQWIAKAVNPPFSEFMLTECESMEQLQQALSLDYALGQGFYFQNLCFINQVDAGEEWLVIRNDLIFESLTFQDIIRSGKFIPLIESFLKATDQQLKERNY